MTLYITKTYKTEDRKTGSRAGVVRLTAVYFMGEMRTLKIAGPVNFSPRRRL